MAIFDYTQGYQIHGQGPSSAPSGNLGYQSYGPTGAQQGVGGGDPLSTAGKALKGYNFYQEHWGSGDTFSITDLFGGGSGTAGTGGAEGATGIEGLGSSQAIGEGGASSLGMWAAIAALIGAKAEDTRKSSDVSYEDQFKNISLAPQKDWDKWNEKYDLDKYAPPGWGEMYKGGLDLLTGDFSNWAKSLDEPFKAIKDLF